MDTKETFDSRHSAAAPGEAAARLRAPRRASRRRLGGARALASAAALLLSLEAFAPQALATTTKSISQETTVSNGTTQYKGKSTDIGDIGGGMTVSNAITAAPNSTSSSSSAGNVMSAKVFDNYVSVMSIDINAKHATANSTGFSVGAFGQTLSSQAGNPLSSSKVSAFYCASAGVPEEQEMVGPIPVVVEAKVLPCAFFNISGEASDSGLNITLEPSATVGLQMELGVGSVGVSAGIEAELNFVELTLPIENSFSLKGDILSYHISGIFDVILMSGSIDLYAKAVWVKYSYTLLKLSGIKLFSVLLFTDSIPIATGVGATISGNKASGSYFYSDSADLPDYSKYSWYLADDANGTNASKYDESSQDHKLTILDNKKYLRFCVKPFNGANYGTETCGDWTAVGHLATFYKDANYSGSSINVAYEQDQTATCYNMSDYSFNDVMSSLKVSTSSSYKATLLVYKDANCSGTYAGLTGQVGTDLARSTMDDLTGSLNDEVSSFRVVWNESVSVTDVSVNFSSDSMYAGYSLSTAQNMPEVGSIYQWYQATSSSGTSSTYVKGGITNYPLTPDYDNKYMQLCVTPSDGISQGNKQCSSWTSVGHTLTVYSDANAGGTGHTIPYEKSSNGTCMNLSDFSTNDSMSSFTLKAATSASTTVVFYPDADCSGTVSGKVFKSTASAGSSVTVSDMKRYSGWNDVASSFRVVSGDSITVTNLSPSFSGNTVKASYTYYSSAGLTEKGTTYIWSRASDSLGSFATPVGFSSSYTLTPFEDNKYLRVCVTAANDATTASQTCSSYMPVGHLAKLFSDASYSGSSLYFPYERSTSGTCVSLGNYSFNDMMSSFQMTAPSGKTATVTFYQDTGCSGSSYSANVSTGGTLSISDFKSIGSSWNDTISSFAVKY